MRYRIWKTSLFALAGLGLFFVNGLPAPAQFSPQYQQPPQYQPPHQHQHQQPHQQQQPQVPQPSKAAVQKANVQGKYYDLQTILYVPKDRDTYTNFCDWDYANSMDYAGYENVPAGYWVYNYPHWFIWRNMDASKDFSLQMASVNGKYGKLLEKLSVPEDVRKYGKFRDTGYQETRVYDGTPNLPPGYWVYHFPHWYIWAEQTGFGPKQKPFPQYVPKPPSYNPHYHQPHGQQPQYQQPHGHSHDGRQNPYRLELDLGNLIRDILDR